MASTDSLIAANAIISLCKEHGFEITNMKLQKLLYFAYAIHLFEANERLFDAEFEAWNYGPVVRDVYSEFKRLGNRPIEEPVDVSDPVTGRRLDFQENLSLGQLAFLSRIVTFYGRMSAGQLVNLSHAPGAPWDVTVRQAEGRPNIGMVITDDAIRAHYQAHWIRPDVKVEAEIDEQESPTARYRSR